MYLIKYIYKVNVRGSLCKERLRLMEKEFWWVWYSSILTDELLFLYKLSNRLWQSVLYPSEIFFSEDWVLLKILLCPRRHWKSKHAKKLCLLQRDYILYWKNKVGFCFHWLLQTAGSIISNLPKLLKTYFIWEIAFLYMISFHFEIAWYMFKGMNLRNQKGSDDKIFSLRKSWLCNLVQNMDIHHSPHAAVPTTLMYSLSYWKKIVFFCSMRFMCLELKFGLSYQIITW